ncbi:hypothetical protein PC123_g9097 [Phytophthora cactorum]|nr:hypothetical protein PC120_g9125 [Phytophthora cactorum]KAG4055797.1 hypothetical protein PC123_g9097 [Phytophthora cactorum]
MRCWVLVGLMSDAAAAIMAVCCQRGIADRAAAAAARVRDCRRVCHRVQVVTCTVVALTVDKRDKGLPLRRTAKSNGALDAEPTTALDCEAQICSALIELEVAASRHGPTAGLSI